MGDPNGISKITLEEFPEIINKVKQQPLDPNVLFINPIEALNRKGEIFAHYGMYQRALGIYSMILRMDPVNLTALLNTATVNYKKEKYNRVISILERLFVIHPNHEHIIAHRLLLARSYVMKGDLGDGIKNLEIVVSPVVCFFTLYPRKKLSLTLNFGSCLIDRSAGSLFFT